MSSSQKFSTLDSMSYFNRELLSRSHVKSNDDKASYLKFFIDSETPALVPMNKVQEAAVLSSRLLTSMPMVPPYMLGLINRRGKILWVLDLSQIIGMKKIEFIPRTYSVLVIKVGAFMAALAVHRIDSISRIDKNMVSAVPNYISSHLIQYLEGCFLQDKGVSLILDVEAIAQSPLLQVL